MSELRLCDLVIPPKDGSQTCLEFWSDSTAPSTVLTWNDFKSISTDLTNQLRCALPTHSLAVIVTSSFNSMIVPLLHSVLLSDCSFCPVMPTQVPHILSVMQNDLSGIFIMNDIVSTIKIPGYKRSSQWINTEFSLFVPLNINCIQLFPKTAYHIFTSGSTGDAKLVRVPHSCICSNIEDLLTRFLLKPPSDAIALTAPLTFDPSIVQIYLALSSNVKLVIPFVLNLTLASSFVTILLASGVSLLQCTPSMLLGFGKKVTRRLLSPETSIRWIVLGGEPCPPLATLQNLQETGNTTQWFSIYGVTEVSCWATIGPVENTEFPTLGSVMRNTELRLSDDGEIEIGRKGRSCEVNGQTDLLYKTGDLGKWDSSGRLLFLGRKDRIIKRWGLKLNLYLLESCISKMPFINHCCCDFNEHNGILTAMVSSTSKNPDEAVKIEVLHSLGAAYVPTRINSVDRIPTSQHGKANMKIVNVADIVTNLWKMFLGPGQIKQSSRWLENGGDSLGALGFASNLENLLSVPKACVLEALLTSSFDDVVAAMSTEYQKINNLNSGNELLLESDKEKVYVKLRKRHRSNSIEFENNEISNDFGFTVCSCQNQEALNLNYSISLKTSTIHNTTIPKVPNLKTLWKYSLGKCIDSSALIFIPNDINSTHDKPCVLIGSHSRRFVSLNAENGTVIWSTLLPGRIEASATLSSCSFRVLIGCYDGCLYVLSRKTGSIEWVYSTKGQIKTSPCILQSKAYFGSHDGYIHAVDICSNLPIWRHNIDGYGIVSSPTLQDCHLFVATLNGSVSCLSSDSGVVEWSTVVSKPVFSSLICAKSILIIGCVDASVYGLHVSNGNILWKFGTEAPIFSSPSYIPQHNLILIGCHDGRLYAINSESGTGRAICHRNKPLYSSPACIQNNDRLLVVCCDTVGTLFVLDIDDSQIICELSLPAEIFSSPVLVGDSVVIGCRDDNVYSILLG